jgi:hypothetical protein
VSDVYAGLVKHAHALGDIVARRSRVDPAIPRGMPKDDGCACGGPSCLACRLPICIEDVPGPDRRAYLAANGAESGFRPQPG